jgi:hypothetical protein
MATSGSFDFVVNRDDIIREALEQAGVISAEESISSNDLTSCSRTLNMMVKAWQGRSINIFTLQRAALFLEKNKSDYTIGRGASDKFGYAYGFTALDGAVASSGTSLTVDSITGINNGDEIGIKLSDGTMHWDVVNGAPSGTTVTITTGLASAASDNAVVYFYTATDARPLRIQYMLHRTPDGTETPGRVLKQLEYIEYPNKTVNGTPLQGWYDRRVDGGIWKIWPETDQVDEAHILYVHRQAEDFDAASDDADYPQEAYWCLAINLAKCLIPKYGVPRETAMEIRELAREALFDFESFDVEDGFYIQADPERRSA